MFFLIVISTHLLLLFFLYYANNNSLLSPFILKEKYAEHLDTEVLLILNLDNNYI